MAHQAGAYPGFCSMKRQEVFPLPMDGMLVRTFVVCVSEEASAFTLIQVLDFILSNKSLLTHLHRRVTPSIKFTGTYLYFWGGERHYKSSVLEHDAMPLARTRIRTTRSGNERTNQKADAPQSNLTEWW